MASIMPIHVYLLSPAGLTLTEISGPTLDAVSLKLPEGIYTTLRTYDRNHILGLTAHLQRLADSHTLLNKPCAFDFAAIRAALRQVIEQEELPAARLRLTTPFDCDHLYLGVEPFASFSPEFYAHGVRCVTTHLGRETPKAKYTGFIAPSRAIKAETDPEIHELLMVNEAGQILEGLSSNFYAVMEGTLFTAGEGVLEGVTRKIVLAEAQTLAPVSLTAIRVGDLPQVGEAFITSSGREVMPVRQIDETVIGDPGPLTQTLMARYRAQVLKDAELP